MQYRYLISTISVLIIKASRSLYKLLGQLRALTNLIMDLTYYIHICLAYFFNNLHGTSYYMYIASKGGILVKEKGNFIFAILFLVSPSICTYTQNCTTSNNKIKSYKSTADLSRSLSVPQYHICYRN